MDARTLEREPCALLEGDPPSLVKPGEYELRFHHYETLIMFGRVPKLVLWFRVVTFGEYFDAKLPRFYNVTRLIGRPQRNGRFKVGFKSNFLREYVRIFRTRLPSRLDRIPMSMFERYIIVGRARTVTKGSDQKDIPDALKYSVLDELTAAREP